MNKPVFWTNIVTLYSRCGDVYVRAAEYEGCFWKRQDSLVYDGGRKLICRGFTVRIPEGCLIAPGDVLVLGRCGEEPDGDFLKRHAGNAFEVKTVLQGPYTKVTGTNVN